MMGVSMKAPLEEPARAIELALAAFRGLLQAPFLDFGRQMPVLVIALQPEKEIQPTPVPWSSLAEHVIYEPPTLYVIDRRASLLSELGEEYRCSIKQPVSPPEGVEFNSYYRCYRDSRAREHDWEFERSLYLEAHKRKQNG
ncbi:MAG: hypothetical protein DRJ42_13805 [Deltaproteobacteria bacterium]|nr:MAG: hypothetical protein DRJ42_13805 [Deltaproteobacteria bacterium]